MQTASKQPLLGPFAGRKTWLPSLQEGDGNGLGRSSIESSQPFHVSFCVNSTLTNTPSTKKMTTCIFLGGLALSLLLLLTTRAPSIHRAPNRSPSIDCSFRERRSDTRKYSKLLPVTDFSVKGLFSQAANIDRKCHFACEV